MKRGLPYIVLLASLAPLSLAQSNFAQSDSAIRQHIEAAEAAAAKAVTTKHTATLEKLWSPKLLVNSPANNILTRDQVKVFLSKDQLLYPRWDCYSGRTETGNAIADLLAGDAVPGASCRLRSGAHLPPC